MMKSGLGIRPELFGPVEQRKPEFGFLEAHSENYFGESISRAKLLDLRADYPVSLHGVGLSLGRADHLNQQHLAQLKQLVDEVEPILVSEHLAWSAYSHRHLPDLLPLPLTSEALDIVCQHIDEMQTILGRQILVENPSNYLLFEQLQIPEPEFLNALAERTGCGLLMDVNNIHVSAANVGRDSKAYIDSISSSAIGQYHLAGYIEMEREHDGVTEQVLIDTHNQTVYEPVWHLFEHALNKHGARPTLFEWDSDFPEFEVLEGECAKANGLLARFPHANDAVFTSQPEPAKWSKSLNQSQDDFLSSVMTLAPHLDIVAQQHKHRVWIYQNNVFGAVQDYLSEVYPATRGVVGNDFFKQMAHSFVQEHAPEHGNIHLYGDKFVGLCGQIEGLEALPYLADLIRYEWALHSAYFAKTSDALDPNSLPQEELLGVGIAFNDSVSIFSCGFPVYEIHRQSLPDYSDDVSIDLGQSQDRILVYKLNHKVNTLILDDGQFALLTAIEKKSDLLQAIEYVQGSILADTLSVTLSFVFETQLLKLD